MHAAFVQQEGSTHPPGGRVCWCLGGRFCGGISWVSPADLPTTAMFNIITVPRDHSFSYFCWTGTSRPTVPCAVELKVVVSTGILELDIKCHSLQHSPAVAVDRAIFVVVMVGWKVGAVHTAVLNKAWATGDTKSRTECWGLCWCFGRRWGGSLGRSWGRTKRRRKLPITVRARMARMGRPQSTRGVAQCMWQCSGRTTLPPSR